MDAESIQKELGAINQWQKDHERHDDDRFKITTDQINTLATKEDIAVIHSLLVDEKGQPRFADKEDVARLNNYVQTFSTAVELLKGGSKWIYYSIIILATLYGAFAVLTGGLKGAGIWFMHSILNQ